MGRANYLPITTTTDWRDYTLRMIDLMQNLGARHYIKRDLQRWLPEGYDNPMRVAQNYASRLPDGREHDAMPGARDA